MAADSKDTAVTDDNTETAVETAPEAAAKASNASSAPAKKLSPEALIRSFESAQQKDDLPEIYVGDTCLLYTSPSPRDSGQSRMPSSA